ncbi:non-hydrolyzing UDP-N-acetylglucosamine 2-epimerase [Limosilactobacillus equigenerosi]|uniref:UDP-N-acetylglucosamine 2-epimerase (non-hydrolyzing) n=1 Tax=Limosilactobacillus equigenerosi DSM 18793 = JCM 14505 TaxID=1423742 RepID=A0A0R1URP4_9LACO|nr:UDP-N-acetylglucosamine 2-epimerase (non-hydrolyzing) [Limosilactobacillus equigenerosi]KRL93618.1 UDP-N-acetylglucosamine 2-epimerase [Limosilactobacillus equigenerosi DSM 18793 = JCM 14505]
MRKVMIIFGTRPEAIKMIPIIKELNQQAGLQSIIVTTGQHRELVKQMLAKFSIESDIDLDIMAPQQTLTDITTRTLQRLEPVIKEIHPDIVLVHGDTTTTMAASLAAYYQQIPVGHVEAGLRTGDKYSPYPEELNRVIADAISDLYFAPTELSQQNLLREHHQENHIYVTGNTAIDMMKYTLTKNWSHEVFNQLPADKKLILLTMHRRENWGSKMAKVFAAMNQFVNEHEEVAVVFPVHPNPIVQKLAHQYFDDNDRVQLIKPLDVIDFHNLAARSWVVLTDSGGIQEEAPALKKPVLVLRESTERPEGVTAGVLRLVGTNPDVIKTMLNHLLHDEVTYQSFLTNQNPYGDGQAAQRIVKIIAQWLLKEGDTDCASNY